MAKRRRPLVRNTLFCLTWLFFHAIRMMPLPWARRLGRRLAGLAYHLVPRIKHIGRANLDIAYGDTLSSVEKDRILRASVENLGVVAAEFPHLPRLLANGFERCVVIKGREHIKEIRGAVLIGAHHGNWEWMLPVSPLIGLQAAAVVREFDDPRMNALVEQVRLATGITIIHKDNAMGALLREARKGVLVGLLADQNPRENAAPVTFFGRQTWATIGPALLAMRAKMPIVPISMVREKDDTYTFRFHPVVDLVSTGTMLDDLVTNTQRCQDALEAIIREHPGQWLWFHRRWKKRERLEREWNARKLKHNPANKDRAAS